MSPSPSHRCTGTLITAPHEGEVLRLFPEPTRRLAAEDVYSDLRFPVQNTRPYVLINMVASLDGKTTIDGKAGTIGSPTDRLIMRTLRARVDAVMVGSGTLRAEKLRLDVPEDLARARTSLGLKPQPLAIIVAGSNDIPLEENLLGSSPDNLLILTSPETPKERFSALSSHARIEVIEPEVEASSGLRLDLVRALKTLKQLYAVGVLLVEGGPSLNHTLVSSGLADELFLTLSPKLLGGDRSKPLAIVEDAASLPTKESSTARLISIHLCNHELFLRYSLRSS